MRMWQCKMQPEFPGSRCDAPETGFVGEIEDTYLNSNPLDPLGTDGLQFHTLLAALWDVSPLLI